jgi:hypothetical protein
MTAWNQVFSASVKQQRESGIENVVNLFEGLENIPDVCDKTAWEFRWIFWY